MLNYDIYFMYPRVFLKVIKHQIKYHELEKIPTDENGM